MENIGVPPGRVLTGETPGSLDGTLSTQGAQSPQSYATRIKEHAERAAIADIYSGVNFRALAGFLTKPYLEHHTTAHDPLASHSARPLVCVHSVVGDGRSTLRRYTTVGDCEAFSAHPPSLAADAAHVTWLSGCPAPEWINTIGAQYRIDPEFFRRHLVFMQSNDNQAINAMPSSTERMVTIRLTTICRRPIALSRRAIDQERRDAADSVRRHQRHLSTGDSIVRKYEVFDNTTFTIDQEMAVYVDRSKQHDGWIVVICSDLGKPLTQGFLNPWTGDRPGVVPTCEPVTIQVPKIALERPPRPRPTDDSRFVHNASQMSQNASLLAETFTLPQIDNALRLDIRDTLQELFAFAAAAECQYLTMMQELVERELQLQSSGKQTEVTLSNIRYFKSSIDSHTVDLKAMLAFLRRPDFPRWTRRDHSTKRTARDKHQGPQTPWARVSPSPEPSGKVSEPKLDSLADDYSHLLEHATRLSRYCIDSTGMLMNIAMLEESKKAIIQADGLRRLTLLTFFFLPLSLTTSFFGMNFDEFGSGKLTIWVCFVVAVPFVCVSIALCFWESVRMRFQKWLRWTKRKRDTDFG